MPVHTPNETNFLYRFEAGSNIYLFTNIAENQIYNSEEYEFIEIEHTPPTFSGDPEDAEIDVTIIESNSVAELFINGPPAYPIILTIFEYDRVLDTADFYHKVWLVRAPFQLDESVISFHGKSRWHFFERESFTDSLAALSRYSVYDPRSGIDIESFRVGITVTALNSERDILTVTGISEPDDHFKGGLIIAPDRNMRTILAHVTEGGNKKLYLNGAFPQFTLDTGFTADIYPGDDLQYSTWANKFGAVTNNGEAFGGWPFMPNVDPAVRGVI